MKKLIALIGIFFFCSLNSYAETWKNDLRSLFQNNSANIYVINIRSFSAEDKNHDGLISIEKGDVPGTFTGAAKRLDSLKAYGINTIHLMPITPVGKLKALGTAGSLYAMDDFSSVNPQFDDVKNPMNVRDEAKYFISEAHKRNIRVIVDLPSCGSYDLYLRNPSLFAVDAAGNSISPVDWNDVRLFKTQQSDGALNQELLSYHKDFIDMVKALGADGVRADVATIKPYEFWKELISYARRDDSQFLFVAEASPAWTEPAAKETVFTPYNKLVSAGFDGYLGNYMNYLKFSSPTELFESYKEAKNLSERCGEKKSILLNFATHDDISPLLVNSNFPFQLLWLSATLPGNMYFVNGFITGDPYLYQYENKKADKTYTDNEVYYVHKGKLDIFNFAPRAGGRQKQLAQEYKLAVQLKNRFNYLISETPNILKTSNNDLYAYEYEKDGYKLIVILNHNQLNEVSGTVSYRGITKFDELLSVRYSSGTISFSDNKFKVRLAPSDIAVFLHSNQQAQSYGQI